MMLRLFLFALCELPLRAATVILTVTGRVSETDVGSFFPNPPVAVGDPWTVTMTWHYPTAGTQILEWSYFDPGGSLRFEVNGYSWEASHLAGGLGGTSFNASLYASTAAPAALAPPGLNSPIILTWRELVLAATNKTSLPQSFSDWNLPAASAFSLEVGTDLGLPSNVWDIKANAWDTMTIQVIPEPSASAFVSTIAMAALLRRRRLD